MEELSFYVNKKIVYVDVVKTKNKNMYLKVINNKITVLVPPLTLKTTINKFVNKHIERFVKYIENQKQVEHYSIEKNFFYLFGEKQIFKVLTGFNKSQIIKKGKTYYFEVQDDSHEALEKLLLTYLKKQLFEFIVKMQRSYEKKMNVEEHEVGVNNKTTAWATNYGNSQKIIYASNLAFYNKEIIEYIIIHELAHFHEMNHSQDFWKIVAQWSKNYKAIEKQLKDNVDFL